MFIRHNIISKFITFGILFVSYKYLNNYNMNIMLSDQNFILCTKFFILFDIFNANS